MPANSARLRPGPCRYPRHRRRRSPCHRIDPGCGARLRAQHTALYIQHVKALQLRANHGSLLLMSMDSAMASMRYVAPQLPPAQPNSHQTPHPSHHISHYPRKHRNAHIPAYLTDEQRYKRAYKRAYTRRCTGTRLGLHLRGGVSKLGGWDNPAVAAAVDPDSADDHGPGASAEPTYAHPALQTNALVSELHQSGEWPK